MLNRGPFLINIVGTTGRKYNILLIEPNKCQILLIRPHNAHFQPSEVPNLAPRSAHFWKTIITYYYTLATKNKNGFYIHVVETIVTVLNLK